jgi:hypothetical protein
MKYLYFISILFLTSCYTQTRTISYDPSYQSTTTIVTNQSPIRPFGWWFRPSYLWTPRPQIVYTPYYIPPRPFYMPPRQSYIPPRPKPQNSNGGPRGGRRK